MKTDSVFIGLTPELKQRLRIGRQRQKSLSDYVKVNTDYDYIERKENEKKRLKNRKCPHL